MASARLHARRRAWLCAVGLGLLALLPPRGGGSADLAPPAPEPARPVPRRPLVPEPRLTLTPASIELAPGERVELVAVPSGGEAMLFSVDWSIREGSTGGTLLPGPGRREDGSYAAIYQAPGAGSGSFHVVAALHEFPAVRAEATIRLRGTP